VPVCGTTIGVKRLPAPSVGARQDQVRSGHLDGYPR
jgi:hypothetical protein